jgi:hypothetical protein
MGQSPIEKKKKRKKEPWVGPSFSTCIFREEGYEKWDLEYDIIVLMCRCLLFLSPSIIGCIG